MSEFKPAVFRTLEAEKGYVNDPADPGGETNFGITRRWADSIGLPELDIRNLTREKAAQLYETHFWKEYRYELVDSQALADELFDMCVVSGPHASHLCVQRALWSVAVVTGDKSLRVKLDGILGPATRATVNRAPAHCLLAALKSEQAGYFRDLDKPRFEKGWEARAYS